MNQSNFDKTMEKFFQKAFYEANPELQFGISAMLAVWCMHNHMICTADPTWIYGKIDDFKVEPVGTGFLVSNRYESGEIYFYANIFGDDFYLISMDDLENNEEFIQFSKSKESLNISQ